MPPDLSHLLDSDAVPEFIPSRPSLEARRFRGGGAASVSQGSLAVSVSAEESPQRGARVATSESVGVVDRFTSMDFRVRWGAGVAYINRGRVHFPAYSPTLDKFIPFSYVVAAQTLPLPLEEGDENASVWLSLPFLERDYGSGLTALRTYAKPDSTRIFKETYWSGFQYPIADGRVAFGVATADLVPTPVESSDYLIHLANVGFSSGVKHIHFGSAFPPSGFDAELTRD